MTHISCYDDTEELFEMLCEAFDMTEPELLEWLIDIAIDNEPDVQERVSEFLANR